MQQQPALQEKAAERPVRQVDDDGVKEEPGAQVGVAQEEEEDHPSTPPLPPMAIALVHSEEVHLTYLVFIYSNTVTCLV